MQKKLIFGCIADDFTGASDAASFLVKGGLKTVLINGIPPHTFKVEDEWEAIVIALKTRTQKKEAAVEASLNAMVWLKKQGIKQLYFKYCSTFDSTEQGNIGPVIDAVLEEYPAHYTILCPALPVNKRIVKSGHLYVDGIPLHKSHMKNHPLTPMWESDIKKLMEPQGKYSCFLADYQLLKQPKDEILKRVENFGADKEHFYVITDYIEDKDAEKIVDVFGDIAVLTGGSGLMETLGHKYCQKKDLNSSQEKGGTEGPAIILSGSCSTATLEQIRCYQEEGGVSFQIHPLDLMSGKQTIETMWDFIKNHLEENVLVYSSDDAEQIKQVQKHGAEKVAKIIEEMMAELAKRSLAIGINRIIVAGGETAGAVMRELHYHSYVVSESVAPGVPVMIPLDNVKMRLVLKSGNFGQRDFFQRALASTSL